MRIIQVAQRPQLITNLRHNLTFASDKKINEKILTKYRLYKFLTPCDPDNQAILQSIINEWSDYFNEYYRIYQLRKDKEYRPLENYRRVEDLSGIHHNTVDNTIDKLNNITKNYDSGYNSDSITLTNQVESTTDKNPHSKTNEDGTTKGDNLIYGNIGVTTAQQMLQQELDLIKNIEDMYISKFAEAFNLDMEVDFYGKYI